MVGKKKNKKNLELQPCIFTSLGSHKVLDPISWWFSILYHHSGFLSRASEAAQQVLCGKGLVYAAVFHFYFIFNGSFEICYACVGTAVLHEALTSCKCWRLC